MLSHLRLVVSISRQYLGYGLPHGDLIQEGNIGLMKAVKRFDPEQGVRLVSYAMHWIKAEIHEYILRNWRMVKVATTKAQRKLFFNLRSMKQSLKSDARRRRHAPRDLVAGRSRHAWPAQLNVKPEEVLEMETRLSGGDIALEPQNDDGEESYAPIAYLADDSARADARASRRGTATGWPATASHSALDVLDARSRRIVEERWLKVNDDSSRRHDAARAGGRVRRQRRAHPPDRGGGAEEDAQGAGTGSRLNPRPALLPRRLPSGSRFACSGRVFVQQQLQVVAQRLGPLP